MGVGRKRRSYTEENDNHHINAGKRRRSRRQQLIEAEKLQVEYPNPFNLPTAEEREQALGLDRYMQDDDEREAEEFFKDTLKKPHSVIETDSMRAIVTEEIFKTKSKFNIQDGHFRVHFQFKSKPTYNGTLVPEMLVAIREILQLVVQKFRTFYTDAIPGTPRHDATKHNVPGLIYFTVLAENLTRGIHSGAIRDAQQKREKSQYDSFVVLLLLCSSFFFSR